MFHDEGMMIDMRYSHDDPVQVGGRWVPSLFSARVSIDGSPAVDMLISTPEGLAEEATSACIELTVSQTSLMDHWGIQQQDLRRLPVTEWVDRCVKLVSQRIGAPGEPLPMVGADDMLELLKSARPRRRRLNAALLQRVASIYNATDMGGLADVIDALKVSKSTAVRYINLARDQGYIAPKGTK